MGPSKKNSAIAVIRVVSMFLIVLCHIVHYFTFLPGHQALPQLFNVGVYVFLIISGSLYADREIPDFKRWILTRWKKLVVPMYVVVVLDFICLSVISGFPGIRPLLTFAADLQGIGFLGWKYLGHLDPGVINLGPLWFLTIIMLCYCLIPVLQRHTKVLCRGSGIANKAAPVLVLCAGICFGLEAGLGICVAHFLAFSIGYLLKASNSLRYWTAPRKYLFLSAAMVIGIVVRLLLRAVCDGSGIYTAAVSLTHTLLGFWLFVTAFVLERFCGRLIDGIANNKVFQWFERYSFYVFLTHGLFCMGDEMNVFLLIDTLWIAMLAFTGLTLLTAIAVKRISDHITASIHIF